MLYAIHIRRSSIIKGKERKERKPNRAEIFCIHLEDGKCSLQNHDSVSLWSFTMQTCYSFQMIPERKRVLNLNNEKTNIIKQILQKTFVVLSLQNKPTPLKMLMIYQINIYVLLIIRN